MENQFVYSNNVIEFVTVVAETCFFLENCNQISKEDFVTKSVKLLPLLYLKSTLIDKNEIESEGSIENFVTEEDYLYVKEQIETLLGTDDAFLDTFHPDMQYSDTPIAAFISENLADVYQELKDFASNYQIAEVEIMECALYNCLMAFEEHWGQKLLNSLRALHSIRYNDHFGELEEDERFSSENYRRIDRNAFLRFQTDDEDEI